jgi:hypothetical protein
MYQKGSSFYADWKTPDGKRKRKAFPTEIGAKRHETKQKAANSRPRNGQSAMSAPASSVTVAAASGGRTNSRSSSAKPARMSRLAVSTPPTLHGSKRASRNEAVRRATRMPSASGASSKRSPWPARTISAGASYASTPPNHGRSGRPKTKRVAPSPSPISPAS